MWTALFVVVLSVTTVWAARFVLSDEIVRSNTRAARFGHLAVAVRFAETGELRGGFRCHNAQFPRSRSVAPRAFRAPVVPLLTAVALKLGLVETGRFGRIVIAQVLALALVACLLFLIARRLCAARRGGRARVAAALTGLSLIFFQGFFDLFTTYTVEPLYMVFGYSTVLAFMWSWDRRAARRSLVGCGLGGVLLGLTIMTKPTLLYLVVLATMVVGAAALVLLLRRRWRDHRAAFARAGLIIAGAWLSIIPWAVRNFVVLNHQLVLATTDTGLNLYRGAVTTEFLGPGEASRLATPFCELEEVARSKALRNEALRRIAQAPGAYAARKLRVFLRESFVPSLAGDYADLRRPPLHRSVAFVPDPPPAARYLIYALFFVGLGFAIRERRVGLLLLLAVFLVSNAVSSVPAFKLRFFVPYLPIYFLLAAFGVESLWRRVAARLRRRSPSG